MTKLLICLTLVLLLVSTVEGRKPCRNCEYGKVYIVHAEPSRCKDIEPVESKRFVCDNVLFDPTDRDASTIFGR